MKISIVIPNYNGVNFLPSCLNSLKSDKFNYLYVIIVDNGSNDGCNDFLVNEIENVQQDNIEYYLISNDFNLGFSKAVNQGIRLANTQDSEYVCLLNNDVEVGRGFLDNLVKVIEKDENIFSVNSKMLQYNNRDLIDDAGDEYNLLGWTKRSGYGKSLNCYSKEREIFSSCAGASLYRKSVFGKIGYFDENFFAYMEDVDIGYRARINGFKNVYSPEAIAYHHGSGSSGSRYNEFKIKLAARNNIFVPYKNMPIPQLILNFLFLLLGFFIKFLFFLIKGYGEEYLTGLFEGLKNLNKVERIKYKNKNIKNYFKIELELILNLFKF
jgi:GT2 family glycosyltransferase